MRALAHLCSNAKGNRISYASHIREAPRDNGFIGFGRSCLQNARRQTNGSLASLQTPNSPHWALLFFF